MKIRIVQAGYETFSGLLGDVDFKDGASIKDLSEQQAAYISAMFTTEQIADDDAEQAVEATEVDEALLAAEAARLADQAALERAEAEAAEVAAAEVAAAEAAAAVAKKK